MMNPTSNLLRQKGEVSWVINKEGKVGWTVGTGGMWNHNASQMVSLSLVASSDGILSPSIGYKTTSFRIGR